MRLFEWLCKVTREEARVHGGSVSCGDMARGLWEALSYWFWIFRLGVLFYLAAGIQSVNCTEAFSFRHESRRFMWNRADCIFG